MNPSRFVQISQNLLSHDIALGKRVRAVVIAGLAASGQNQLFVFVVVDEFAFGHVVRVAAVFGRPDFVGEVAAFLAVDVFVDAGCTNMSAMVSEMDGGERESKDIPGFKQGV